MKKILLSVLILGATIPCFAKAAYMSKQQMIRSAECIVIVTITDVSKANSKGKHWTYGEKATATVEQCLKGDVKGQIEIFGLENFECAQCNYEKGRFLLFLDKDGALWTGCNWQLGIRPITDDKVKWFEKEDTSLAAVIKEIKKTLKEQEKEEKASPEN